MAGLLVRLGQALAETGSEARAQKLFSEADRIYRIVPGVHHPFYTEVWKMQNYYHYLCRVSELSLAAMRTLYFASVERLFGSPDA